jgi:poly-gamma-glutamate synthesis protein (capsule biosynthesis protein)
MILKRQKLITGFILVSFAMTFAGSLVPPEEISVPSYSIACPFFTLFDSISQKEFTNLWVKGTPIEDKIATLLVDTTTRTNFESKFGKSSNLRIKIASFDQIQKELSQNDQGICAIVPTVSLQPNWKRISIDGLPAPWDKDYDQQKDPLAVPTVNNESTSPFLPEKATTLLMTGTTALTRTTAYKMMLNGINYPGEKLRDVFFNSDLRHISNESSFWSLCPQPVLKTTMQFCTPDTYLSLFDYLGINLVELTGNHLRDYDWPPLLETLTLLEKKGYPYYGAGRTPTEAAKVLFVEHNGNQFAFLGCNIAGPDHVFVTEQLPGVNRCDFNQMEKEIRELTEQGYLVIVSLQYYEIYSRLPSERQEADFQRLSDAGAVVISGSQAHYAQTMIPSKDRFIHYGLGNLFFDQMDHPITGTRQEFLDRYVFYDGKLIQVELKTALLMDYAQPRLMTDEERYDFLNEIFSCAESYDKKH